MNAMLGAGLRNLFDAIEGHVTSSGVVAVAGGDGAYTVEVARGDDGIRYGTRAEERMELIAAIRKRVRDGAAAVFVWSCTGELDDSGTEIREIAGYAVTTLDGTLTFGRYQPEITRALTGDPPHARFA